MKPRTFFLIAVSALSISGGVRQSALAGDQTVTLRLAQPSGEDAKNKLLAAGKDFEKFAEQHGLVDPHNPNCHLGCGIPVPCAGHDAAGSCVPGEGCGLICPTP
jgi:hypothetical protein